MIQGEKDLWRKLALINDDITFLLDNRGVPECIVNWKDLKRKVQETCYIIQNMYKWDLIEKENNTTLLFEKDIREKTAHFTDYPILFISAINKQRIHKVL